MYNYESKLVDSSRIVADMIVSDVGSDPHRFSEIIDLVLRDEYPLSMRASRVMALVATKELHMIVPHLSKIVDALRTLRTEGVKRGILYMFAELPIDLNEEMIGIVTDSCFTWLNDTKEAIAIRYYAIEILVKVVSKYPELKSELADSLHIILENEAKVLHAKSRKAIKMLEKI